MKSILWKMTFVGTTMFALFHAVPQGLASFSAASHVEQHPIDQSSITVMNVATGGANLRVRSAPDGEEFVTCLEDQTPIMVTQYSSDRQWAFVTSQQSTPGNWVPVNGWVRTQYVTN